MEKSRSDIERFDNNKPIIDRLNNFDEMAAVLETGGQAFTLTKGASMRPLFREHRDIAVIKKLDRKPMVNDVLLYRKRGYDSLVLHRLLKIKKDGSFVIRGDNNYFTEYEITQNDIVGVLKEFYREGKYCSCENKKYLLYSFYIRHSYPLRFVWKKIICRPFFKVYTKLLVVTYKYRHK